MKNGKRKVIAKIAGPGLVLAALLVLSLSNACIGRAQAGTASPAVTPAMSAEAVSHTPAPLAAKPPAKGQHEGIKVHGHWTIEVRNPDGKLVSHTEFENSLTSTGQQSIANLLLGYGVPGGFLVRLTDSNTTFVSGPCAPLTPSTNTNCILVGSLISPLPAAFGEQTYGCGGTGFSNQIAAAGPCFPLRIAVVGTSADSAALAFSGTAVASSVDSVSVVYLGIVTCGFEPGIGATSTESPNLCAQSGGNVLNLTSASLPTPVAISAAGQLISVNVQLSFQ
jgi:hypothetical protein